jgi:hypothetical protein
MPALLGKPPDESIQRLNLSCHQITAAIACMSTYLCRLY